jgi:inner membrane protein
MNEVAEPASTPASSSQWGDQVGTAVARPAVKFALLCVLLVLMLIPSAMVSGVVADRASRQAQVETEFRQTWGPPQSILGPLLVVPYISNDAPTARQYMIIAPSRLSITTQLVPEIRRRGFFSAVVYTAQVQFSGTFALTSLPAVDVAHVEILWADSTLVLGAKDLRAVRSDLSITWNGAPVSFTGTEDGTCGMTLATAPVSLEGLPGPDHPIAFKTSLDLRGSKSFHVVPVAAQTRLTVAALWPSPAFTGSTLPVRSQISPDGFNAEWDLAGPIGGGLIRLVANPNTCTLGRSDIDPNTTGADVALVEAVSTYHMVERTSKYTILFLAMSFLTYFLFEILSRVPISLVRYALLGFSISLFALLLVSLAEPLGFTAGYTSSAALVGLQGALFTVSITGRLRLAAIFALVQAVMFIALFIIINMETYALLAGSGLLFITLSAVMAATRRIDFGG